MKSISRQIGFWLGHRHTQRLIVWFGVIALSASLMLVVFQSGRSAGIDDVTVTLGNDATGAASQVSVSFTFGTLVDTNTIKIYLGDTTTGGNNWGLNAVGTGDIACSDNGAGETYTVNSVTAASATTPLWTQITATTVGAGASAVTCTIGDGAPNPTNPGTAGAYSVAVVTTSDSGAGVAYVGNANDVTVSGVVLSNLTLNLDNPDATACTLSGVVVSCNLGTFTLADVNSGNYDVNVGTNAANGATLSISEDGRFRSGAINFTEVVENNSVTAGVEGYGIAVAADGPTWTEQGDFTDDDTPIPQGAPVALAATAGPADKNGNDVTITHKGAISSTTAAAVYSHIVIWTATGNF
jgi:hypothetical protein